MIHRRRSLGSKVTQFALASLLAVTIACVAAAPLAAFQPPDFDFGDAPEAAIAYPATGVIGNFPTCKIPQPPTWIQHSNFGAFFGPLVDFEADGNANFCLVQPPFPPYDRDECFADGDAGLIRPQPFTIVAGPPLNVVPCPNSQGTGLGVSCQQATWGPNVDITVRNGMPNQAIGYVNVIIDWDQNGVWGGASQCPSGLAPEHVLVNFPVPNPYPNPPGPAAPLSLLNPPAFLIGPNGGYVWARFSITEQPVQLPWDGSGAFEDGESEDYLLRIDQALDVTVEGFAARPENGQMVVSWSTVSEIDNAGFRLLRGESQGGPFAPLAFLPSHSPGGTTGAEYLYVDADVQAGRTYWYRLEDVSLTGATSQHGLVSATLQAPTVVSLAGMATELPGPMAALPLWSTVAAGLAALASSATIKRRSAAR